MQKKRISYKEDEYLDKLIDEERVVKIYLRSGVGLMGKVLGVDEFSILLSKPSGDIEQIIYKDAISSINLNLHEQD